MTVRERSLLRDMVVRAQLANDPHLQQKRRCCDCKQWKLPRDFYLRQRKDRPNPVFSAECRRCSTVRKRNWRATNPEKERAYQMSRVRDWAAEYQRRKAVDTLVVPSESRMDNAA